MALDSALARRARRKLLSASLIAALALPAAASSSGLARNAHIPDFASSWYPHRPADTTPQLPRTASQRSPAALTTAGKPLVTCDDAGLRNAIAAASTGDVLDLTACSTITLTAGEIYVIVDDLTLNGPGAEQLTIDGGSYYGRIFRHTGAGTLSINNMTLANATYASFSQGSNVRGGCIYSAGSVALTNAVVTACALDSYTNDYALGGAIYAREDVTLVDSAVTANVAYSAGNEAEGGGIFARNNFSATEATVADNTVIAPFSYSLGGGVAVLGLGDVAIVRSTLSGNAAEFSGGAYIHTTGNVDLINSTIASNYAARYVGGATMIPGATLTNSTVTGNTAGMAFFGAGIYGYQLTLQGSIAADNLDTAGTMMVDVYAGAIGGGNSLIVTASSTPPVDTIRACPRLTALQDNGGPTLTRKLISSSPAVDAGSNTIPVPTDQRSTGFPRTFGVKADIGAVEWQGELDDNLFKSAFEVRCDGY